MAGWFRSPAGVLAHADGPSQERSYTGRGYTPVADEDAKREIGDGIRLTVSASDTAGTFDDEQVRQAVREESPRAHAHRPARKAAKGKQGGDKAPDSED